MTVPEIAVINGFFSPRDFWRVLHPAFGRGFLRVIPTLVQD